jgi:hypothetical protein
VAVFKFKNLLKLERSEAFPKLDIGVRGGGIILSPARRHDTLERGAEGARGFVTKEQLEQKESRVIMWEEVRSMMFNEALFEYAYEDPATGQKVVTPAAELAAARKGGLARAIFRRRKPDWNSLCEAARLGASMPFHFWLYHPDVKTLGNFEARRLAFGAAVEAAGRARADIFLGPEYLFLQEGSRLDDEARPGLITPCSDAEMERLIATVRGMSSNYPRMLILSGSAFWRNAAGEVRNRAFISCQSRGLFLAHDKARSHNDDCYAYGRFVGGAASYSDFTYGGLDMRFQICKDNGSAPIAVKDVLLLSGYSFGAINPCTSSGGWTAVADGMGEGRLEQIGPGRPVPRSLVRENGANGRLSLAVDVRKVMNG